MDIYSKHGQGNEAVVQKNLPKFAFEICAQHLWQQNLGIDRRKSNHVSRLAGCLLCEGCQ